VRIIEFPEIQSAITFEQAIDAVRSGFVASAQGRVTLPDPMQILFHRLPNELVGDCHVKAAQATGLPYFVIKIATGFYENPARNLAVNNGLSLVLSSETGRSLALLQDDGWLTQIRTAAAGALAAGLKPVTSDACLGILGTGTQAMLQAQMISRHLKLRDIYVYGRSPIKAQALVSQLNAEGLCANQVSSVRELCHACSTVVSTTPSSEPVIELADLPEKLHIIAVGADSPGKVEIAPEVFSRVGAIATDSHAQCLAHGDFGSAVRAGTIGENDDYSFPTLLDDEQARAVFADNDVTVVDLTGLGVQDLAMATLVMQAIGN